MMEDDACRELKCEGVGAMGLRLFEGVEMGKCVAMAYKEL